MTRTKSADRKWASLHHLPRGTQAISPKSVPHSFNRAAVILAPSESVPRGTRAVSAPRAVGCVLVALGRLPTEPSRATSVPASGVPGPQPSESQRARDGHPTPSDAGLRPTLSQASSTAPQRPPGYRSRPRSQARASATGGCGTGQHDKRQRFLLFRTTICSAWFSC